MEVNYGILSILPAVTAVALAFITKEATFSLLVACTVGVAITGVGVFGTITGLSGLLQRAMGNEDFIWVLLIEIFIGVLVAFFQVSGSTEDLTKRLEGRVTSRAKVQLMGWLLGMFIFFSDYFSPLFVGPVMKSLTDKAKISREKLAYICDSTSAPVCVLVPFSSWGVYISGLLVGMGPILNSSQSMEVFVKSVFFNFYGILAVVMVGLIAMGIIPEFGPMKKAEERAQKEGKVIADGASPMMGVELSELKRAPQIKTAHLFMNFLLPVIIVIGVGVGSYFVLNSTKTLEAFMIAVIYLGIVLRIQGMPLIDIFKAAVQGIKGVVPAIIILGLAYSINTVSKDLGAAKYVVGATSAWLTPRMLPAITFFIGAFMSFATGTSWGTYAIIMPIAVPLALQFSGNEVSTLVLTTIAAVAGGGVFGDHCSPLSDTTILSSFGAASDHMDHVKTQLPYALSAATLAFVIYLVIGIAA